MIYNIESNVSIFKSLNGLNLYQYFNPQTKEKFLSNEEAKEWGFNYISSIYNADIVDVVFTTEIRSEVEIIEVPNPENEMELIEELIEKKFYNFQFDAQNTMLNGNYLIHFIIKNEHKEHKEQFNLEFIEGKSSIEVPLDQKGHYFIMLGDINDYSTPIFMIQEKDSIYVV